MNNFIDYFFAKGWKVFTISLCATFSMVLIQHLGIMRMNIQLANPMPYEHDVWQAIMPKLEQKTNDYQLKKPSSFFKPAFAGADYDKANAYVVVDYDNGQILAQKDFDHKLPVASLTKIMSAVVALDLAHPEELMTVSEDAPKTTPTRLALTPGEKLSIEELLNAALLTSANDCVRVIQQGIDAKYGQPVFVDAMNAKAKAIGLKNTHFTNPQGFDTHNPYSTTEDLSILTHYALENYPKIVEIVRKDHEILGANANHKEFYLNNWQGLIGVYPGAYGVKIGNTEDAGMTTTVVAERAGKKILVTLLGAPGVLERDMWAAQLLDEGFDKSAGLPYAKITEGQLRAKYATWKYFQ